MPAPRHRSLRIAISGALAALLAAFLIGPAAAAPATAYRFWGFFQYTGGSWAFAKGAPAETVPADGSVEGWRFAVSGTDSSRLPRATASFEQICAATPAREGSKRVGVIVDFGRTADSQDGTVPPAPLAVCAVTDPQGSSLDALRAAGEIRSDKGLICAVKGYPATGCGGEVADVSAAAAAADTPVTLSLPTVGGAGDSPAAVPASASPAASSTSAGTWAAYLVVALVLLALVGVLVARSRRAARSRN